MARRAFGIDDRWVATGQVIAEGGQAHVHVVLDSTGVHVGDHVIKLLKNTRRTPRLDREISETKRLRPLGCAVLEIVDDYMVSDPTASRPWYVTRRFPRGSLASHLSPGEPFGGSFESAIELYKRIVEGVLGIHGEGVAHRDLKPANVLLDDDDDGVVLADLGLAMAIGETEGDRLTEELERIGSLHYTPPEAFSRRPVDPNQFAFDAFALGKIMYECLAGRPLPAFVGPTDPEFDLVKQRDTAAYRALNRVLRGLLHDDPAVRLAHLRELPGQIDELVALDAGGEKPGKAPRWHTDLLTASDLLASRATAAPRQPPEDMSKAEAEQIAKEALEVWQESDAIERLESVLGTHRGGHLVVTRPVVGDLARSQLGGLQATRHGLEPFEDLGYPHRPKGEAGVHMSVASSLPDTIRFRQLWLCMTVGVVDTEVYAALSIIRRELGLRASTDVVEDRIRLIRGRSSDPALVAHLRDAAEQMLSRYIEDVIAEVQRAANA